MNMSFYFLKSGIAPGAFPVVVHRPIPDGFILKTATSVKKADGYYVGLTAERLSK